MSAPIISATQISKKYQLGAQQSGSLKRDLQQWWQRKKNESDEYSFWALQDISFSIQEGEVTAFIGNNGAGKSTLLKILSGVIAPTSGRVEGRGSIASLLEIGTGFHPELTGRENVYLNGHLLGMSKVEINASFDAILDFAGIGAFIDTPVKRYSSGMYVRLAFAIAAHVNPDILIVDEVLAVGDTAFQQKCVERIKHIAANNGKSIILVSHNMTLVEQLCNTVHWLEKGRLKESGNAVTIVNKYLSITHELKTHKVFEDMQHAPGNDTFKLKEIQVFGANPSSSLTIEQPIHIRATVLQQQVTAHHFSVRLILLDARWNCLIDHYSNPVMEKGKVYEVAATLPADLFNPGFYYLYISVIGVNGQLLVDFERVMEWYAQAGEPASQVVQPATWGLIRPKFSFDVKPLLAHG